MSVAVEIADSGINQLKYCLSLLASIKKKAQTAKSGF